MKQDAPTLRPAMTALAAVIALSATPLLAQAADAPPLVTPPPVSAAMATPVPARAATPAPVTSPAPAGGVVTAPIIGTPSSASTMTAAPVAAPPVEAAPVVVDTTSEAPAPRPARSERAATPSTAQRTAGPVATPAPAPVAEATPAPVAVPTPAPAARATPPAAPPAPVQADVSEDVLPIGLAGLGILALGGGAAFAFSRRRRSDSRAEEPVMVVPADPILDPSVAAPGMTAPVVAATAPAAREDLDPAKYPQATLPEGFDLSRFGRHTQAAYRGPTPENPSLSLRKRLKVASFYDGRERMAAAGKTVETFAPSTPIPVAAERAPARTTEHITVRAPRRPSTNFRPAWQS